MLNDQSWFKLFLQTCLYSMENLILSEKKCDEILKKWRTFRKITNRVYTKHYLRFYIANIYTFKGQIDNVE